MATEDPLSPEQAARVADAVEDIETNVSRPRSYQSLSRDEYLSAEYRETREAVEREFEKLTAAVIDIAQIILTAETNTVPDHRKATIDELEALGIINAALAQKLRDAIGFRDVLAHSYGPIVNGDIVYDALQNSLERYVAFVEAVSEYLGAAD